MELLNSRLWLVLALGLFSPPAPAEINPQVPDYVGSSACEGCHTYIYKNWRETRHGSTVISGAEAKAAGYPLPTARPGGKPLTIDAWDDVAHVIGRRKRIAYIDHNGAVQDSGYHQRLQRWQPFPDRKMTECGGCHFTGPVPREMPGAEAQWAEMDIGCEACHGPGGRHTKSLEAQDIALDTTSAVCGTCHTEVGNVLPVDDRQPMHELVQNWNSDAHATSTLSHSYSAFCARCHTPFQGHFAQSGEGSDRRVFSEYKQAVSCIGCHNPHELTNKRYTREPISLQPASLPRLHTYRGNDRDFTTTDFDEHETVQQVCETCHSGADRVDLNHAGAQCIDCHNSYNRNRTLESRIIHDTNRPELSCQPCHGDADHLMTILFRDPEFLAPSHVHNLQTLPSAARKKHGFQFSQLNYPTAYDHNSLSEERGYEDAPTEQGATAMPAEESPIRLAQPSARINALLIAEPHYRLGQDAALRELQENLGRAPDRLRSYFTLAREYALREERPAAAELIESALQLDAPGVLLEFGLAGTIKPEAAQAGLFADVRLLNDFFSLPNSEPGDGASISILKTFGLLQRGLFDGAINELTRARQRYPDNAGIALYLGLAQFGAKHYESALESFGAVLVHHPDHVTAALASAWIHFEQNRPEKARSELARILVLEANSPVANYLLGRNYLKRGDAAEAITALRDSITADPAPVEVWFQLARAYRTAGDADSAVKIYQEILARHPAHFDSRVELAGLLKLSADSAAYQHQSLRESPRPNGANSADWEEYLATVTRTSSNYSQLALSEYFLALRLRPLDRTLVHQISDIYRRTGRLALSLKYFTWLTGQEPNEWLHYYRLGTVLIELARYDEAVEALQAARQIAPAEGDVYFALGFAYTRSGKLEQALQTFQRGIIYEPFNPGLFTNLGAVAGRLGRYADATSALQRSLELASFPLPRVHITYTNLALVRLAQGKREEAVFDLKSALHAYPDYQYARDWLARLVLAKADDPGAAPNAEAFVVNDFLQRFGEVTTVAFDNE